jgi:peptide/nickel transport system ATP-binding protein
MKSGQIVEEGPAEKVMSAPQHDYTRALLDAIPHPPM